jgi:hypothetical protein
MSGLPSSAHVAHGAGPSPPSQVSEGERQEDLGVQRQRSLASSQPILAAGAPFFSFFLCSFSYLFLLNK